MTAVLCTLDLVIERSNVQSEIQIVLFELQILILITLLFYNIKICKKYQFMLTLIDFIHSSNAH